ncbi:MAG: hypothetical protein AAGO57_09995 [Pseudomonadota bacterium]
MSILQKIAIGYFVILTLVAAINYIPGLTDGEGLAFGIFALDIYDDALHLASAIWALVAGILSRNAAKMFLILFGAAYLGDGIFGMFTGWGYLDLGIFTNASLGFELSVPRFLANLPHIALGGFGLYAGLFMDRQA